MKTVLLSSEIHPSGRALLEEKFSVILPEANTQEAFDRRVPEADALVMRTNVKVTGDSLKNAENVKIIVRTGAGVDNIDLAAAWARGITVCNLPALNNVTVAEHAVSMLLSLAKQLPLFDSSVRKGDWKVRAQNLPVELQNKVLGVVGLGAIGFEAARMCSSGFHMKVLAYDPYINAEKCAGAGYEVAKSLEELFSESDFITIHVPSMPETRGMITRELLYSMKKQAYFINCARGDVVDEAALYEVLRDGIIAGAAVDVFSTEPPSADCPFFGLSNILLSPHAAALAKETAERASVEACVQVIDFLEGRIPKNIYKR